MKGHGVRFVRAVVILGLAASPALAQVVNKKALTLEGAKAVVAGAAAEARRLGVGAQRPLPNPVERGGGSAVVLAA